MEKQTWQTIDEYNGLYEFSNNGRIRSIRHLVNDVPRGGKELKVSKIKKTGLYCIRLKGLDEKFHFEIVPRLIAKAFVKNEYPNEAKFVAYIDDSLSLEDGLNSAENLAWVSFRAKAIKDGNVPIVAYDSDKNVRKNFFNVADAKEKLNLSSVNDICKCLAGKEEKACGYSWAFSEKNKKKIYVSSALKEN